MTTLAQPAITAYTARGHIPYSVEVAQDYPGFATEIQALLEQGYVDLIALKTLMGSGTSEPWGIFPAILAGGVSVQVTSTTDGAFGGVDVFNVWNALPERFRSRASWVMSVSHESAIRQFATGTNAAAYFTVDLTADGISRINGRPVYVTDYAPALSTTTGAASRLVVGDFQHYVIAQRAGITFENIQMLFATANNLPSLQRSRLGWARLGADSVADNGFRILCNT
jgi:HK97 family phage major capsid protein